MGPLSPLVQQEETDRLAVVVVPARWPCARGDPPLSVNGGGHTRRFVISSRKIDAHRQWPSSVTRPRSILRESTRLALAVTPPLLVIFDPTIPRQDPEGAPLWLLHGDKR